MAVEYEENYGASGIPLPILIIATLLFYGSIAGIFVGFLWLIGIF